MNPTSLELLIDEAADWGTPPARLEALSDLEEDHDYLVLMEVAGNPSTPMGVLVRLAADAHYYPQYVMEALERNPALDTA
jgi:hypothetical protein